MLQLPRAVYLGLQLSRCTATTAPTTTTATNTNADRCNLNNRAMAGRQKPLQRSSARCFQKRRKRLAGGPRRHRRHHHHNLHRHPTFTINSVVMLQALLFPLLARTCTSAGIKQRAAARGARGGVAMGAHRRNARQEWNLRTQKLHSRTQMVALVFPLLTFSKRCKKCLEMRNSFKL